MKPQLQPSSKQVILSRFSNQTTVFSCGLDGQVLAYDANKYRMFRRFKPDTQCQLHTLAIDESGDIIFASSFDPYEVYSWNVKTANLLQIIKGHEGPVGCIGMAGEYLLTGSWDRSLQLHQVYSRKLNTETLDHSSQITALAIHPSNKEAAVSTVKG
jgi:periodic tryptophan protein 2